MAHLPKGVYDELLTASLRSEIERLPRELKARVISLSAADTIEYLARKIAERARAHLSSTLSEDGPELTIDAGNRILGATDRDDPAEAALLQAIHDAVVQDVSAPLIPLSQSALVTNDQRLNYHAVLRSELASSDRVDLICPFIGNQGLNLILDLLANFGSRLRVITTTYLGATNQRALDRIAGIGAQIKIVYERSDQKTGLHAKSWIFHRETGFTTATVGSSNLSPRALVDGLEWNIRLSAKDALQVLQELIVTFDRLWEDPLFEAFEPGRDTERLARALRSQRADRDAISFFADLQPLPHQREALEELAYARLEGKTENLIVAATGTGKTLLAAFDYQRLCREEGGRPSLLFVAHRKDILEQSLGAFRAVMKDSNFGELHVGSERAGAWRHVFASVQALHGRTLAEIARDHFDVVVIDEFHHAEAPTYLRILDHFRPKQLLGLTATPERADGKNVIERFGSPTYELRLWHALDRKLLSPFHYFGIDDRTDLSGIAWSGGRYADSDLDRAFVEAGEERARLVIRELLEKVEDLERMRVVAFCATIRHAEFMADQFRRVGLEAKALHSGLSADVREELVGSFRRGELPIICTVDLFNEGVDIPEIDTVLFLRPTESATVFVQQLGRGLRNHAEKGALTVLDFVGQQNRKFRMDLRFRAMTGLSRSELERAVKTEFPTLPPGCHIRLDRTTQDRVLRNIREAIPASTRAIVDELRRMRAVGTPVTLGSFLHETGLELADVYKGRSFHGLKQAAGLVQEEAPETKRVGSFIHVDDRRRIEGYHRQLIGGDVDIRFARMMAFTLTRSMELESLNPFVREEMLELLSVLETQVSHRPLIANDLVFSLHSHYSRDEIVSVFRDNPASMRQGTFYVESLGLDVHIVTLRKSERDFSPTTRYADYFVAPDQLHWESQSTTSAESPTGQRLIHGHGRHLFFVREDKDRDTRTAPFLCLGFARPLSAQSEKPIKLAWKLEHSVPDHVYLKFLAASG
jgi:superfamily II DNA or RNA helicase/HKD family nuclease